MKLKRLQLSATNRPIEVFSHWRMNGYLLLDPPYQRGDVWGPLRQQNLIRSILMGIPIPSLIVNSREGRIENLWDPRDYKVAVIDGKQRITAILKFLDNHLNVPGEWFDHSSETVTFNDLTMPQQRGFRQIPIAVAEGTLRSLQEEQEVFELVNFGGVPQGETDLPIAV